MSKKSPYLGEVIGLAVMLLLVVALVAAQADDSVRSGAAVGDRRPAGLVLDPTEIEPDLRLRAVIDLDALTIVIDASAKIATRGSLMRGN